MGWLDNIFNYNFNIFDLDPDFEKARVRIYMSTGNMPYIFLLSNFTNENCSILGQYLDTNKFFIYPRTNLLNKLQKNIQKNTNMKRAIAELNIVICIVSGSKMRNIRLTKRFAGS